MEQPETMTINLTAIENDYRFSACPFCNSSFIKKIGDLNYQEGIQFSSHIINLKLIPEIWKCNVCRSAFTQNVVRPEEAEELYNTGDNTKRWPPKEFTIDKTKNNFFMLHN